MTLDEIIQEQDKMEHQTWMDMLDDEDFEDLNDILQPFPIITVDEV